MRPLDEGGCPLGLSSFDLFDKMFGVDQIVIGRLGLLPHLRPQLPRQRRGSVPQTEGAGGMMRRLCLLAKHGFLG